MNPPRLVPLSKLTPGTRGRIVRITRDLTGRVERLAAFGVTPGASIRLLQRFPGIVFECDQTEMAVERAVAAGIVIEVATERETPIDRAGFPAPGAFVSRRPAP
jgi:Fe2+ transport system protein FeoA